MLIRTAMPDRSFDDALFWARGLPARTLRRLERRARNGTAPNNYPANRTLAALRAALSERHLSPMPDRLWRRIKKGGAR